VSAVAATPSCHCSGTARGARRSHGAPLARAAGNILSQQYINPIGHRDDIVRAAEPRKRLVSVTCESRLTSSRTQ